MKNELKHIKNTGHTIPDGYFNAIEDHVMNQLHIESKFDKNQNAGFKVPDVYFDSFEDRLFDTINTTQKQPKVITLKRSKFYYVPGVAASIVLLISIFMPKQDVSFETLDQDLVDSYVEEHYLNTEDFAALLSESEIDAYTNTKNNLSDDHLEDYFFENSSLEDLLIE